MSAVSPKELEEALKRIDIVSKVQDHWKESREYFPKEKMVACLLQGSQNYGLETSSSDVDTKLIVVPSFKDICLNKKPVSTTHVRQNNEHTDWKDVRLYMETFRKQNLNFLEILFTDYYILNPLYEKEWRRLVAAREEIARMNPYRAVKSMKGIALEKYHAMEHKYPTKLNLIEKYGYDGKQVSHLIRVDDYIERYIAGESYKSCLHPTEEKVGRILAYKRHEVPLEEARIEAAAVLEHVVKIADEFCEKYPEHEDEYIRALLEDVSYEIMRIAVMEELK